MNPETREHILERHCDNGGRFRCGCYYFGDHTILMCQFHLGYDEGIDRFRPAAEEPTDWAVDEVDAIRALEQLTAEATELRAWGDAIIRATLTELRTEGIHIGAGAEEWIDYDAIIAAAEEPTDENL